MQKFWRTVSPQVLLVWVFFYISVMVILLAGSESMPWRLGFRVDSDIISRVDFEIVDTDRTEKERESARDTTPDIYIANDSPVVAIANGLTELLEQAKSSAGQKDKLAQQVKEKSWSAGIDDTGLDRLLKYAGNEESQTAYGILVKRLISRLSGEAIVLVPADKPRPQTPQTSILRRPGRVDNYVLTNKQLQHVTDRKKLNDTALQIVTDINCPEPLTKDFTALIVTTLAGSDPNKPVYNPLWLYDKAATAQAMEKAAEEIPNYTIPYKAGNILVRRRMELDRDILGRLNLENEKYLQVEKTNPQFRTEKRLKQLGTAIVVLLLTIGLVTYIASYQDRIFKKPARALGLAALMLLMIGLSRLSVRASYPWHLAAEFSVCYVVIAAALLAIAYDQRFAFGIGGALSILVALASRGDIGLFLTLMVAMSITVFTLREIRSRSKIIAVGAIVAVGAFITSFAVGLIAGQEIKYVLSHALAGFGAAIAAGFFVQGILPNFEKLFGVATSMTLLEWCDASRPLLRRLAQDAPGTYSHSLVIGQMCEEACGSIEARGLLGRVGALYHDVGKLQKSAYFVENQEARMNRHDQLSPTMSLLIIIGHVKDGIELARAYGLPRIMHHFIAEHHGTTVVKYFHHMASEAAAKNGKTKGRHDRDVSESEFRYPGPKPQSKESAILMLCDTCEGAVRASTEPTPGRIESTVHSMVMDRLNDGQFDECDITLRELKIVERSMVKSLCAIHHGRIKYPTGEGESGAETPSDEAETGSKPAGADKGVPVDSSDETPEVARQA